MHHSRPCDVYTPSRLYRTQHIMCDSPNTLVPVTLVILPVWHAHVAPDWHYFSVRIVVMPVRIYHAESWYDLMCWHCDRANAGEQQGGSAMVKQHVSCATRARSMPQQQCLWTCTYRCITRFPCSIHAILHPASGEQTVPQETVVQLSAVH